jgi:WD40 repeat protein
MFRQPMGTPVRSLACTSPASPWNLCLAGGSDGNARLYDLDGKSDAPPRALEGQHHGAISSVAFSPDGKACATGSEDHSITIWETASGKPLYHFLAHRGPVTSLRFTPLDQLVSAGRDNILSVWTLGNKAARREEVPLTSRSGDVAVLGASPDGRRVLFDQGKMLRVVSIPQGVTEGVLENPGSASNFTAFALFSPDGHLILTASTAEGRMQLWRSPAGPTRRVYEVRQLVSSDRTPTVTCAAFSPDGTFIVTGGRERQVLTWAVPSASEVDHEIAAEVTLVEPAVESANGQVRIWASFPNRDGRLLPGGTVAMAVYPPE